MHKQTPAFAIVLVLLCTAGSAQAQTPHWSNAPLPTAEPTHEDEAPRQPPDALVEEPPDEAPYDTRWYGYQIMLVDVASVLVMGYETEQGTDVGAYLSMGGLFLGAPLMHVANGQGDRALTSGGLRVGLTLGGYLLGGGWTGELDGFLGGILLGTAGLLTAVVYDWTVLSKKKIPRKGYSLTPTASVTAQGVNVGLVGRF